MFLSRAVLLVEGLTEKLALPFVFEALGYEPDSEGILDPRDRRQGQHVAVRAHLQRVRDSVRRRCTIATRRAGSRPTSPSA